MTKVAKAIIALVTVTAITAVLHLTGELSSKTPIWVYWVLLIASAAALAWLIVKLRPIA